MNTKRTYFRSIWRVAGISLVAMTISTAGFAAATELRNGAPVFGLSASKGEELHYTLETVGFLKGRGALEFSLSGGTGDADLYVRIGSTPSPSTDEYDDMSNGPSNNETCSLPNPEEYVVVYVTVLAYEEFSGVSLVGRYTLGTELQNNVPTSELSASEGESLRFYLQVPPTATSVEFALSGGAGDADLIVTGDVPVPTCHCAAGNNDCRPRRRGTNDEVCSNDEWDVNWYLHGMWYVMVYAFEAFSGATLVASYEESPCAPSPTNLCLNRGRFRVEVDWRDFQGNTGPGKVVPVGSADSGLFWFFDPDNWEMLVKILDACGLNNHFWVFAAATTNVEYTLRVTDTETGAVREYRNLLGNAAAALTDTGAFATCR